MQALPLRTVSTSSQTMQGMPYPRTSDASAHAHLIAKVQQTGRQAQASSVALEAHPSEVITSASASSASMADSLTEQSISIVLHRQIPAVQRDTQHSSAQTYRHAQQQPIRAQASGPTPIRNEASVQTYLPATNQPVTSVQANIRHQESSTHTMPPLHTPAAEVQTPSASHTSARTPSQPLSATVAHSASTQATHPVTDSAPAQARAVLLEASVQTLPQAGTSMQHASAQVPGHRPLEGMLLNADLQDSAAQAFPGAQHASTATDTQMASMQDVPPQLLQQLPSLSSAVQTSHTVQHSSPQTFQQVQELAPAAS